MLDTTRTSFIAIKSRRQIEHCVTIKVSNILLLLHTDNATVYNSAAFMSGILKLQQWCWCKLLQLYRLHHSSLGTSKWYLVGLLECDQECLNNQSFSALRFVILLWQRFVWWLIRGRFFRLRFWWVRFWFFWLVARMHYGEVKR